MAHLEGSKVRGEHPERLGERMVAEGGEILKRDLYLKRKISFLFPGRNPNTRKVGVLEGVVVLLLEVLTD